MEVVECSCGAKFEKTVRRFPQRDKDNYLCDVCGEELDNWNATSVPFYKLISRPESKS